MNPAEEYGNEIEYLKVQIDKLEVEKKRALD